MTYNTTSSAHLRHDSGISDGEGERVAPSTVALHQESRKPPTPGQLRALVSDDGIKAFMMEFAASAGETETVAPATRDFLKAASFLFRK